MKSNFEKQVDKAAATLEAAGWLERQYDTAGQEIWVLTQKYWDLADEVGAEQAAAIVNEASNG